MAGWLHAKYMVVGLKSVAQLSLGVLFSGFQGITEGYNVLRTGRINNHLVIPGNKKAGVSNLGTGPLFAQQPSMKHQISPILGHRVSEVLDMGIWRVIWDQSGDWVWRVDSRVILGSILGQF